MAIHLSNANDSPPTGGHNPSAGCYVRVNHATVTVDMRMHPAAAPLPQPSRPLSLAVDRKLAQAPNRPPFLAINRKRSPNLSDKHTLKPVVTRYKRPMIVEDLDDVFGVRPSKRRV